MYTVHAVVGKPLFFFPWCIWYILSIKSRAENDSRRNRFFSSDCLRVEKTASAVRVVLYCVTAAAAAVATAAAGEDRKPLNRISYIIIIIIIKHTYSRWSGVPKPNSNTRWGHADVVYALSLSVMWFFSYRPCMNYKKRKNLFFKNTHTTHTPKICSWLLIFNKVHRDNNTGLISTCDRHGFCRVCYAEPSLARRGDSCLYLLRCSTVRGGATYLTVALRTNVTFKQGITFNASYWIFNMIHPNIIAEKPVKWISEIYKRDNRPLILIYCRKIAFVPPLI